MRASTKISLGGGGPLFFTLSFFNFRKTFVCVCAFLLGAATLSAQTQLGADIDGEAAGDRLGRSVSLSSDGQTLAIGAPFNGGNGTEAGHVRVYKRISGVWTQQGVDIDGEAASDNSGYSVSLSADGLTVAIGADGNDGNGTTAGHVRVYKLISGTWTQQGADIDGEAAGDQLGISVSLSADGLTVAIGALSNNGNGAGAGHVRVYKLISGAWTQQGADIDGEAADDRSGISVSLSADGLTVAIGAYENDGNGSNAGHVRVYKLISGTWTQQGVDIDGEAASDNSGYSVSLSADGLTVAIGADGNDGNGSNAGHVRVYKLVSGTWTQQGADINGEASGDASGGSVSLSSDGLTVAIGAYGNDGSGGTAGHARVYKFLSGTWTQQGTDINGEAAGDQSGRVSLSADGLTVAIGAMYNDGNGTNAGHVRVYQMPVPCPATGSVWYVDAAAASGGTGSSWACAFQNLQDAIDAASSGQEIWVKAGTYKPTKDPFGNAAPTDPRDKTFYLKDGVAVYGGFAGTETARTQRNWTSNPTILSGDIGTANDNTDNCYHVVLSVSDGNTTVLDGFTVEKGNADIGTNISVESQNVYRDRGAGLHSALSSMVATNCIFSGNTAGQGAGNFNRNGSPTFTSCAFSGNTTTGLGGGTYNLQSTATLTNCTYSGNSALNGGGVANNGGTGAPVTNCTFSNNSATAGGGMYNNNTPSALTNCTFLGNTAAAAAGGLFYANSTSSNIVNCLFSGNTSNQNGGGMHILNSAPTVTNCTFSGNSATFQGGGIYTDTDTDIPTFKNCLIWNNRAGGVTSSASASLLNIHTAPTITYSLLQNWNPSGTGNLNGITNAANSNYPYFVTPLDPATAPSTAGDFHLSACSPILNLGDNTGAPATDLFGNPRPFGGNVDMGVHELQSASAIPAMSCPSNTTVADNAPAFALSGATPTGGTYSGPGVSSGMFNPMTAGLGTRTITYMYTSPAGCSGSCTFTIEVIPGCPATGTIWYVDGAAAPGGTGTSWACAFKNVQDAINAASAGHEVWVKAGTYLPTKDPFGNASPADPRDKTFYLKSGVALYGGFAGTEIARSQRNWTANVTTLSGDIGTVGVNTDNCYHVVLSISDAITTVFDGFTVEKGNSNGTGSISVQSRTIERNYGGGMYLEVSPITLANCVFTNNSSSNYAGGLYFSLSDASLTDCTFSNNMAVHGAGVTVGTFCNPSLTNCAFTMNVASGNGGGMHVVSSGSGSSPILVNCSFVNNSANSGGGYYTVTSGTALTNCTFSGNTATNNGGGMVNVDSHFPTISGCIFSGNSAASGGAVYNGSCPSAPTFTNCMFSGNKGSGGGMFNAFSPSRLVHCSFSGNLSSGNGGALINHTSNAVMTNCLIWNNRAGATTGSASASMYDISSAPVITYSLIQNHNPNGTDNLDGITNAANSNYPNFVTPLDPATAPSTSGDFHLTACSPVLNLGTNTGAPTTDLYGNARPFGTNVDLGVHELQAAPTPAVATCQNATVRLDGAGNGTLTASALDNGSTGCTPLSFSASQTSFNCSNLGSNTVTLTVTGYNGATSTCNATVTVADQVTPNALCRNVVKNLGTNGMATITAAEVDNVSNDNCGTVNLVGASPSNFMCANIGMNTVTLTVNDGHGNTATCNATVTVADNTAPTAVCQNITVNLSGNSATITASQLNNGSTDNCGTATAQSVSQSSFTCANLGPNTVTLAVADGSGNTATCTATATVRDVTPPTALCQNITVNLSGGTANVAASQVNNGSSDNCGTPSLGLSATTFTCVNLGANTVTLTVADGSGNTATCTATVTVQAGEINVRGNGMDIADGDNTPSSADHTDFGQTTGANVMRTFTVQNVGATPLSLTGITLGGTNANQFSVGALNPASPVPPGQSATFNVTYTPNTTGVHNATVTIANGDCDEGTYDFAIRGELTCSAPTFTACPTATVELNTPTNGCAATATYNVMANGLPAPALTYTFTGATTGSGNGTGSSLSFNKGTTTVTVTATNPCGAPTCTFSVRVTDNVPPSITCPTPMTVSNTSGQCGATITYMPTVSDNCSGATFTVMGGPASGSLFSVGTTAVQLQATDAAGLTATCAFTVRVHDAELPSITCFNNIIRSSDANACGAVVAYTNPTYSDNCSGAGLDHLSGGTSGSTFPVGTTNVVWMATDAANNTRTCSFSITVNDAQAPTITCPANMTRPTTTGQCAAQVTFNNPAASDNCAAPTLQWVSGGTSTVQGTTTSTGTFGKGTTTVQWKATDGAGLTKTCTFRIIVNDTEAPTMSCPSGLNVNASPGQCVASVTYSNPTYTDNCAPTSGTAVRVSGPASGSFFAVGTTNVVFRATDAASNTRQCTLTVTVVDNQPPTISCPPSLTVTGNGTPCAATAFYVAPTASDNCAGTLNPFLVSGLASGSVFPAGTTVNTWRALDPNGMTAQCAFTVTVNCPTAQPPSGAEDRAGATSGLSLMPNPAATEVTIAIQNEKEVNGTLSVYDATGRLVWQQTSAATTVRLDVSAWPSGVYAVSWRQGKTVKTKRLVVARG